jgi:hypothetical protein
VANKHRQFDLERIMDSKLMGKYLIIIMIIITFISCSEAYAIVSFDPFNKTCMISGEITPMDVNQVKNLLRNIEAEPTFYGDSSISFTLNSTGGDIFAAMEIGKLIRKARATCWIGGDDKCYSACVLVLAGAVDRIVVGQVGIHRPYSTYVGNRDYQSTQTESRRTETAVRAYLREMNLPGQLFEAMLLVPPEKIRILSDEETEAFGLSGTDPVEQEARDAMDASKYGISKTEYLRRKADVRKVCPLPRPGPNLEQRLNAQIDCSEAYMFGVPLPTYKARAARAKDVCSGYKPGEEYRSCYLRVLRGDR